MGSFVLYLRATIVTCLDSIDQSRVSTSTVFEALLQTSQNVSTLCKFKFSEVWVRLISWRTLVGETSVKVVSNYIHGHGAIYLYILSALL